MLEQKINEEIRNATKSGNKMRLETLRMIRAAIIEFNKSGIGREMTEDDAAKLLNNAAKKRRDAIELYEKGGRHDLADKEKAELEIIQEFLPKQMSEEEIRAILQRIISETGATGPQQMGKVMGLSMKEMSGKANGTTVQSILKELLGS